MDHSLEIERLMRGTQQRIMSDVVRRIRINQNITRTADWQLDRLTQLGEGKKEVRRILQEQLGLTADEIEALYKEAAESGYARSEELYKAVGRDYISLPPKTPCCSSSYPLRRSRPVMSCKTLPARSGSPSIRAAGSNSRAFQNIIRTPSTELLRISPRGLLITIRSLSESLRK